MIILYLTSTGNNLFIAKHIGGELYSIPKLLRERRFEFEDEAIGIIFPCYYFGTPKLVKQFLESATLKSPYIFAVMSCGNMSAGGIQHFLTLATHAGIELSYTNEILMIDNYVPMYDMEQQRQHAPKKHIEEHLETIVGDIRSKKRSLTHKNLGSTLFTFFAQQFYTMRLKNADKRFRVEESCNGCKICEKVCPVNNIDVQEKPRYLHHCEECLACTHHCPQHAIRVKHEKNTIRFINEHVSVKEIIDSNN